MPNDKAALSPELKYSVAGIDIDNLSIEFDGKADGPGPGHYGSPGEATRQAADWIWVYAESAEKLGRFGRGKEWTTYIFKDVSTGMYGFTTPEPQEEVDAHMTQTLALRSKLPDRIGTVFGSMHSHPRGRPTAAGLTAAMAGETVGPSERNAQWETYADSENFSPPDRVDAYKNPLIWHILLTPKGAVKAIQVKGEARSRFQTVRAAVAKGQQIDDRVILEKILKDETLFHHWLARSALGAYWHPRRDWYSPRLEYVKREMSHSVAK